MELLTPSENPFDQQFFSHPEKPLRVHTQGVLNGTCERSSSPVAQVAALFHDTGKLNPHFQAKLRKEKTFEYSKHAYLSALVFTCFSKRNKSLMYGQLSDVQILATLAIIAHHHGHLPNLRTIFDKPECEKLHNFLQTQTLPFSDFLSQWLPHKKFEMNEMSALKLNDFNLDSEAIIPNPLAIFMETQRAFAALIHADKRDASDNAIAQRHNELQKARTHFSSHLQNELKEKSKSQKELDQTRTRIRHDVLEKLAEGLTNNQRTFSLTAPTGAGKTLMMLAIADAIRVLELQKSGADFGVLYALPFLSITEQVEGVCSDIFKETPPVTRADSRTQNKRLEELLQNADDDPQVQDELIKEKFAADTFDHAFIVTTFVQFCETLMSNRNARLLKLPNFAKTIFLLDEIQALPPRLYTFFVAYLQKFCEDYDCYAIFSTATMPMLEFAEKKDLEENRKPQKLFPLYKKPIELAKDKHFKYSIFDRYRICRVPDWKIDLTQLATRIKETDESCLVILNTIKDTRDLYAQLKDVETKVLLLNTHFTPHDRRKKLDLCREHLHNKQRVILISTQLIEAGVDISFPVVFRDLCPLPNLIQCAGRCNRHHEITRGTVWFFELQGEDKKSRAKLIYKPGSFLDFSRTAIPDEINEIELLKTQRDYFDKVKNNLSVGEHGGMNLIEKINELAFCDVGKFRLIEENEFGEEKRFYIEGNADDDWNELRDLSTSRPQTRDFNVMKTWQIKVETCLRKLNEHVVAVRVGQRQNAPASGEEIFGLSHLNTHNYDFATGLKWGDSAMAIL